MTQPDKNAEPGALSARKQEALAQAEAVAGERTRWIARNRYFYDDHYRYLRFLVPEGSRVLDLGCGIGDVLAVLAPARGVGLDISPAMVEVARQENPSFEYHVGDVESAAVIAGLEGPFDAIILSDTIGNLEDIEATIESLHALCTPDTRLIVSYYSRAWQPLLRLAEALGGKQRQLPLNWLGTEDIAALLGLADFEVIKREWRQLLPKRWLGLGYLVNRTFGTLPVLRRFSLRNYIVARPLPERRLPAELPSATVLIPCRNERGVFPR